MIEIKSAKKNVGQEEEMVDLFSIDDVVYSIPAKPRVNLALQYLTDARKFGEHMAQMMLLEKLLGEKGFKALSEYEDLTPEQLAQVGETASKLTLGNREAKPDGQGNS